MSLEDGINVSMSLDTEGLRQDVRKATEMLKGVGDNTRREAEKTTKAISSMGKVLGGLFSMQMAKQFVGEVIKVRGEFQQMEIAFETLTGSAERAHGLMSQLVESAKKTPFDLTGLAQGAKLLMAYGVQAEEVNGTLMKLGDISSGLSMPLGDLVYLYGTTLTQGRMFTTDLRQFMGRGIPMLDELSKHLKVSTSEVEKMVASGKVSAEDMKAALDNLANTKFHNLMEKQSASLTGKVANLKDAIDMMLNEIGKSSQGALGKGIELTATLVENYDKVGKAILEVAKVGGTYKAVAIACELIDRRAAAAVLLRVKATNLLRMAQKAIKISPYALVATAVTALAYSVYKLATATTETEKAQKRLNGALNEGIGQVEAEKLKIETLFATLRNAKEGTDRYKSAKDAILSQYGQYLKGLGDEIETLQDVAGAYDAVKRSALESAKARAIESSTQTAQDTYAERVQKAFDPLQKVVDRIYKDNVENADKRAKLTEQLSEVIRGEIEYKDLPKDVLTKLQTTAMNNWNSAYKVGAVIIESARAYKKSGEDYKKALTQIENAFGGKKVEDAPKHTTDAPPSGGDTLTEEERKKLEEERKRRAEELKRIKEEKRQRVKAISDYWESVKAEELKGELSLREERLARSEDGMTKDLEMNQLKYERKLLQIGEQVKGWVDAYKEAYGVETATISDLSEDQQKAIIALYDESEATYKHANKKALEGALDGLLTYSQQVERTKAQFDERRKSLQMAGAGSGNIEELDRQEADAIKALNAQFAEREESFKVFTRRIAKWGLEQLEEELKKAKTVLEGLSGKTGISDKDIAVASAEVDALEERIREKAVETAVEGADGAKRASEDWQKLYETLRRVQGQFDEIGDAIGGVEGEVLKTAGAVASNVLTIINSITQLADLSIKGIEETAKGTSRAVQMAEKATVVLAIIGAVMQAVQKIANLVRTLTDDKEEQEARAFRLEVQALNGALKETKANAERAKAALQIFSGDDYGKAVSDMASAEGAMKRLRKVEEEIVGENERLRDRFRGSIFWLELADTSGLDKLSQKVGAVVGNIDVETKKAKSALFGLIKWGGETKKLRDLVPELFNADKSINMDALDKFVGSDVYGKLSDKTKKALTDLKQAGEDYKESMRGVQEYLSEVFGQMGSDIMNNIVDAFRKGEDASKSFADSVNATLERMVQNMIFSSVFSDLLKDAEKELGDMFAQGSPESAYIDYFEGLMKDLEERGRLVEKRLKNVKDASGGKLFAPKDEDKKALDGRNREASKRGIAQASQDTVDELNGRATAIQGHTYVISENSNLLVKTTSEMLLQVTGIRRNTDELQRLKSVEDNLKGVKFTLGEIQQKGLKIN